MDEWAAERVLTCVEQVPTGRVVSYGDVASITSTTPRQVGAVLRLRGHGVTWWRVTNASGSLPPHLHDEVRERWAQEGIVFTGSGCDIHRHRADLDRVSAAYDTALERLIAAFDGAQEDIG